MARNPHFHLLANNSSAPAMPPADPELSLKEVLASQPPQDVLPDTRHFPRRLDFTRGRLKAALYCIGTR